MRKEDVYERVVEYITCNQERFYRLAYSHTKDREASLDIVQNAVCKALEKYGDIRNIDSISSWFYRVLVNEVYAYLNKTKREVAYADEEMPVQVYHEKAYDNEDMSELIDKLPENMKTIVILRFFEDMPLDEISKITSTNLNTVKTRLYGALKKLRIMYEEAE